MLVLRSLLLGDCNPWRLAIFDVGVGVMNSMRAWVVLAAILMTSANVAAQSPPINTECPVMEGEPIDPAITTVYKGRTIAFCCDRCLERFPRNPEKYAARISGWSPADESSADASTEEAPSSTAAGAQEDGAQDDAESAAASGDDDMSFFGRVHPALVHVPIAALPIALIAFLAWLASGKRSFANADAIPLLIAALVAAPTYLTGQQAEAGQRFSNNMHEIVEQHESAGLVVMVLALTLAAIRIWRWNRLTGSWMWAYGIGLVMASAVVGITGYLGGSLVFGPDHLSLSFL